MRYEMKVSYDGSNYAGWQIQPKKRTIQGDIENLLFKIGGCKEVIKIESSGRTDAGVHARAQVVHFDHPAFLNLDRLRHSLNSQLDDDIRINYIRKAKKDFHARYDAISKEYRYFIYNGLVMPPQFRLYRFHEPRALNIESMQVAASYFIGEHDFSVFSVNPGYNISNTIRSIYALNIYCHGSHLVISVSGSGFLYKMVRSIAGFLLDVGLGRFDPIMVKAIFNEKERTKLVRTLPPHGLFLWKVNY